MSNVNVIADFETSLATKIEVGGTTATLVSNVDDDGETLPDGLFNFTIDGNNSAKEHILCTKTGANLTAIYSVSRQGVETSGVVREHRVGAKVIMTDFSTYKNYIDNIAIQGSVNATTSTAGVVKLSETPVSPTEPIVVGDNDTRVPTQDENDALAGTGTPSSSNKFVTEDTLASTTVAGLVEEATQAQVNAGTATGETGARLFINPSTIIAKTSGTTTRTSDAASGSVNIAHGLGRTPTIVRIYAAFGLTDYLCTSIGTYTSSGNRCLRTFIDSSSSSETEVSNDSAILITDSESGGASGSQSGVISVDGTNITITWTYVSTMSNGTIRILWEAE